ncbi:pitrilysin family protein [Chitinivorax sp. PXF-14]|uniref:M16 family metallopeptidase n=1 Tax=Chitinivorax sp. PXF-14 TaxID=3230488 RepID=UPI003466212C
MHMRRLALALSLALSLLPEAAPVAAPLAAAPAGVQRVTRVEGITEYRLANGLRVLLAPDQSKPTTTVNVTYLVGSRYEHYGETGMAHLLEHLMFKGTPRHPHIDEDYTRRAMQSNGTTSFDRTNYFETFPASGDNLQWALRMEADRMVNSFIAKRDLDSEMTVVRNEMESGENDPMSVLWQKMTAVAYQWHNYGKDTIGARADVENVNIAHLQAFYRQYYQPDNAVLTVSGKFDEAQTLRWVQQHFGALKKPLRVLEPTYTTEPTQDGEREITLRRAGDAQIVAALYHGPDGGHADAAVFELLADVLGGTPNGRLYKRLVEQKLATEVFGEQMNLNEPGYALFGAKLRVDGDREAVRQALLTELEGLAQRPITDDEVEAARARWLNGFDKLMNDPEALGVRLSESIALGDWRSLFLLRDRIEHATATDLQRVAVHYLLSSNRTLGQFIPDAKPQRAVIPPQSDLKLALAGYQGKPPVAQGEAFDPTPEHIEARTERTALKNGMRLALLPKKTRGEAVSLTLALHFGDEQSLAGQREIGRLAAAMLGRGSEHKSRQQLQSAFDALKTQWRYDGNAEGGALTLQSSRQSLPQALRLVRELLREPAFSEAEFAQLRNESLAHVEESRSDPQALAMNTLYRHFNHYAVGDVRYQPSFDESTAALQSVTLAQVKGFHQRFYGGDSAQLAIVGDFDAAAIKPELDALFGDWRSASPYRRVARPFDAGQPAELSVQLADKANAFFVAALPLRLTDRSPDYPALLVANYILGQGSGLSSRLINRLRQQDGISYYAGSFLNVSAQDDDAELRAMAIYAPQNLERLKRGFSEELSRFAHDGVSEQEVSDAKAGLLQEIKLGRAQDAALAGELAEQLRLGRSMRDAAALQDKVARLTAADINAALKRQLDPAGFTRVFAGELKAQADSKQ